jgi:hypothetical protein
MATKADHEEENGVAFSLVDHKQWVAKSQSLDRLNGWDKNLGRRIMIFHQMIQIMMRNLRSTQKDLYANAT